MIIFTMSIPNIFILNVQSADSLGRRNQKMKEKKTQIPTRVFTIRIPEAWYKELQELAKKECGTINGITKRAIREFLNSIKNPQA